MGLLRGLMPVFCPAQPNRPSCSKAGCARMLSGPGGCSRHRSAIAEIITLFGPVAASLILTLPRKNGYRFKWHFAQRLPELYTPEPNGCGRDCNILRSMRASCVWPILWSGIVSGGPVRSSVFPKSSPWGHCPSNFPFVSWTGWVLMDWSGKRRPCKTLGWIFLVGRIGTENRR